VLRVEEGAVEVGADDLIGIHASVVTILARARKERGDFLTKKGRPRRNGRP
jgi:hypothetical protein